jgi:iron-sulfur cluster repair protein YtfE (RIC family)
MSGLESHDAGDLQAFFAGDHRACDALWAEVEGRDGSDLAKDRAVLSVFDAALRRHLGWEEEVLFPAFEAATGMTRGPTAVMRMEHVQMRGVLDQMARAADWSEVLDQGDTLMMLIGQHNMKEEGMLYPMCDAHLAGQWPGLRLRLG